MKVKDIHFRDVENEICYIEKSDNIEKELWPFDDAQDSTGFLGYGVIDYQDGVFFEVLCRAKKEEDDFQSLPTQYATSIRIKKEKLLENEIEILDVDPSIYKKKIERIKNTTPESVQIIRELDFLDPFRDECYPDCIHVDGVLVKVTGLNEEKGCLEGTNIETKKSVSFALKKAENGSLICFMLE